MVYLRDEQIAWIDLWNEEEEGGFSLSRFVEQKVDQRKKEKDEYEWKRDGPGPF